MIESKRTYYMYAMYDYYGDETCTTFTYGPELRYIIEDGKIRQVTAKELAIEEIKAQPFF